MKATPNEPRHPLPARSAVAGVARYNQLLAALPAALWERLRGSLELVQLQQDEVLYESGREMRHLFFPTTAIVSLVYLLRDGASSELAVVGNEGMVGVQVFMGGATMPNRAVVQSSGYAYRVGRGRFMREFQRSGGRRYGALQDLMLRYAQALFTQMAQMAVCNKHHSLHHRLARCLLLKLDRTYGIEVAATQEHIAYLLGVRREGVTEAAGNLQSAGLIHYHRGHVTVLDRAGLEREACECYQVIKKEYDRLLAVPPRRNKKMSANDPKSPARRPERGRRPVEDGVLANNATTAIGFNTADHQPAPAAAELSTQRQLDDDNSNGMTRR
jgi:CRP-like cAMP-binding protein